MNLTKKILISIYFLLLFVIIILSTFYLSVKEKGGQKSTAYIKQISYQVEGEKEISYYSYVKNPIVEDCSFVTNRRTGVITGKVTIKGTGAEVKGVKIECVRLTSSDEGNVGVRFIEPIIAGAINHAPINSITDDKGEYIIDGLYDGIYELNVKDAFYSAEPKINIGVYGGFVSSNVDFAIVKSVSVSGQIIDKEGGAPLSGINISLKPIRGNFLFSSKVYKPITTNLKGEFVFNYLYPSEYAICFDSEEYSYAGSEDGYVVDLKEGELKDVNIYLTKAEGYIMGIVKDESGKPLSGVGVYLEKRINNPLTPLNKGDNTPLTPLKRGIIETDIEGKFKIEKILFRDRGYELTFRHSSYLPKKYDFKPIKPNDIQEVIIELASGGTITGTVRNEKGEALEKVEIFAVRGEKERIKIPDNLKEEETRETTSDEFGFYRLRGLEEGKYYIIFVREGYALSEPKPVEIKSKETITLDVVLSKEREINGKIQTIDLKPIGGVDVELENGKYVFCSKTREDGAFIIRNIMESKGGVTPPILKVVRKIAIAGDMILQTHVRDLSLEEEDILITLSGITSLRGTVFDSVEDKPVEDYDIALIPLTEEYGEKTYSKEIRQRMDGAFEFKYITAGRYFIKVTARGYKEVIYGAVEVGEDNVVSDVRINMIPE